MRDIFCLDLLHRYLRHGGLIADFDCDTTGFQVVQVPATTWAVFRSNEFDENPHVRELRILFRRAYTEWFSTSGYDRLPGPDLENGKYYEEAWIPVIKK